jgi:DNA polymerase-3 subunit delta
MKLAAAKLAAHLEKGLAPLYVFAGDEPLLVDEALAMVRERASREGGFERESHVAERSFDWAQFATGLQNLSLFSTRRLVELRLPTGKPGQAGADFIAALADAPDTDNVLVFLLPELDWQTMKSKWAAALAAAAVWVELEPPTREELPTWLGRRLRQAGLAADETAIDLLASRVEGNLLAARQEIDKLALLATDGRITPESIRDAVADGARFDVFQLCDAALAGETERVVRVLQGLQREGEPPARLLWNLARDILTLADVLERTSRGEALDRSLDGAGVWHSRREWFRRAVRGRGMRDAGRLVRCAARADQVVKGMLPPPQGDAWNALREVSLVLSGAQLPRAETA